MPSLANDTEFVTDDPSPFSATFATVLPTVKVVTSTSPESVAVPPTICNVKVVTPLIAPEIVISALAILFSVARVTVRLLPVIAPSVISPVPLVALVSISRFCPSVIAPKLTASLVVLIFPSMVTVPLVFSAVSYTHLRAHETDSSRMPSSA